MTGLPEALQEGIIGFCRDHNDGRFPPAAIFIAIDGLTKDLPYDRRIEKSLLESFVKLILHLPDSFMCSLEELAAQVDARGFHGPSVPLHDALDNCGQAICDFALPILYDEELTENGLLADWRRQLFQNEAHMNGLTMYGRRSKAVPRRRRETSRRTSSAISTFRTRHYWIYSRRKFPSEYQTKSDPNIF